MKEWLPLFGVVIAQFVLVGLFFVKQRSDDKRRWHEKRLDIYGRLARDAADAWSLVLKSDEDLGNVDWDEFTAISERFDEHMLEVQLLSSDKVRDRAWQLQALLDMYVMSRSESDVPTPNFVELLSTRLEFEEAVRNELGISKPTSRYAIQADTAATLLLRTAETLLASMFGGPGRLAAQAVTSRVKKRTAPNSDHRS